MITRAKLYQIDGGMIGTIDIPTDPYQSLPQYVMVAIDEEIRTFRLIAEFPAVAYTQVVIYDGRKWNFQKTEMLTA